jgi:hypothetical protein
MYCFTAQESVTHNILFKTFNPPLIVKLHVRIVDILAFEIFMILLYPPQRS